MQVVVLMDLLDVARVGWLKHVHRVHVDNQTLPASCKKDFQLVWADLLQHLFFSDAEFEV
jgi:iron-sulfur cluster repair protein YtfE (RIC family)